jgi:hypothetical protein
MLLPFKHELVCDRTNVIFPNKTCRGRIFNYSLEQRMQPEEKFEQMSKSGRRDFNEASPV